MRRAGEPSSVAEALRQRQFRRPAGDAGRFTGMINDDNLPVPRGRPSPPPARTAHATRTLKSRRTTTNEGLNLFLVTLARARAEARRGALRDAGRRARLGLHALAGRTRAAAAVAVRAEVSEQEGSRPRPRHAQDGQGRPE